MSNRTVIRQIGNALGFIVPRALLEQAGFVPEAKQPAEVVIQEGAIVFRPAAAGVRAGWAEASAKIAQAGDDRLVMGEFGNAGDADLAW